MNAPGTLLRVHPFHSQCGTGQSSDYRFVDSCCRLFTLLLALLLWNRKKACPRTEALRALASTCSPETRLLRTPTLCLIHARMHCGLCAGSGCGCVRPWRRALRHARCRVQLVAERIWAATSSPWLQSVQSHLTWLGLRSPRASVNVSHDDRSERKSVPSAFGGWGWGAAVAPRAPAPWHVPGVGFDGCAASSAVPFVCVRARILKSVARAEHLPMHLAAPLAIRRAHRTVVSACACVRAPSPLPRCRAVVRWLAYVVSAAAIPVRAALPSLRKHCKRTPR